MHLDAVYLVVASMLVEQRDDGFNVSSLDDVQRFWAGNQDTMKDFQDSCKTRLKKIASCIFTSREENHSYAW